MADNLPTNHLPPQSRVLFLREIQARGVSGMTMEEEQKLSCLPVPEIRKAIQHQLSTLGQPLTRPECDGCLRLLALALPRAGLSPADAHDMMDLYFGLLGKAGMTGAMLRKACEEYVMRPTGGKPKFFPDPGQLAELCGSELAERARSVKAFQAAIQVLDGSHPAMGADAGKLRDMSQVLRGWPRIASGQPEQERFSGRKARAAALGEMLASRSPEAVQRLADAIKSGEAAE